MSHSVVLLSRTEYRRFQRQALLGGFVPLSLGEVVRKSMSDEHQVNSIIATAISDSRRDHPDGRIDPEEAKQMAKCIVEALAGAGLQILPVSKE